MTNPLRYGSVCSGIEAATCAWHPLGWQAAWLAEIEPFPSAVLQHHYPTVPNLGDMTTIADRILAGDVEAPDILTGGTPCQAFSVAGLRKGLDDARGQLSLAFCRLANAIDTVRSAREQPPAIVVWENVPGVLSDKGNAFGCFLAGLAGEDAALVPPGGRWSNAGLVVGPARTVCWRVLDAQYFGVAQRRRRVWVVASARKDVDPAAVLFEFDGVRRDSAPSREARQGTAGSADGGAAIGCIAHGQGGAEVRTDGGATTLTCNHEAPIAFHHNAQACQLPTAGRDTGVSDALTCSQQAAVALPLPFDTTQITSKTNRCQPEHGDPCHPLAAGAHAPAIAFSCKDHGADAGEIAPTLRSMGHDGSHANGGGQVAVVAPVTFDWQAGGGGTDDSFRGKSRAYITDPPDRTRALTSCKTLAVQTAMQVRRLTPMECERLQGFPDNYTLIPWRKKPAEDCPDGPRYKALGNSWAVPCAAWIGRRIAAALA